MASVEVTFPREDKPSRVKKWKVSVGGIVTAGRVLLLYQDVETGKVEKKLKASQFGRVTKLLVKDNDVVHPGQVVLIMEGCRHPTVMKDLCAECGADLREEAAAGSATPIVQANVPMVHSVPELKVTPEEADKIGREDRERWLKNKQLVLLVDLDQTIVHTTNDVVPANMEDVHHFQLYGPNSPWYHTRLRPHTRSFLAEVSKLYELQICTFGARGYAHKVASILDSDGKLFSHRILSRDECFDPQSKTANLKALFPCGTDMVCIIDDRDDVWQGCANLVQVKPYHFFLHTGDIHVPPGLGKHDDPSPPQSLTEEALEYVGESSENETGKKEGGKDKVTKTDKAEEKPKDESKDVKEPEKSEAKKSTDDSTKKIETDKTGVETEITDTKAEGTEPKTEVTETKTEDTDPKTEDTDPKTEKTEDTDPKTEKTGVETEITETKAEVTETKTEVTEPKTEVTETEVQGTKDDESEMDTKGSELENKKDDSESSKNENTDKAESSKSENKPENNMKRRSEERQMTVQEDHDDYLLYLEDILKRIHREFYDVSEVEPRAKSLGAIIPKVRSRTLKGLNLTFSGLIPNNQKLHQSRVYKVARVFGAEVSPDINEKTTHLVAIQPGTAKVREAKKGGKIKIVNPDWLWTCAERWEHVDERLYPLREVPLHKAREFRKPPAHCSTPEHGIEDLALKTDENFANTINPLMVFTPEEIKNMDKEVDDDMSDLDDIDDEDEDGENSKKREHDSDSDDLYGYDEDYDEPATSKRRKHDDDSRSSSENFEDDFETRRSVRCPVEDDDEDDDEDPVTRFRHGGDLPDDLDLGDNSQDSVCDLEAEDMEDEREWNAMGAALEREFLSD